jgi:hypothetical protein
MIYRGLPGSPRRAPVTPRGLVAALCAGALALVAGCSSGRSPEAYCSVYEKHKQRFIDAMGEAQSSMDSSDDLGVVVGLAQTAGALGDLQRMWEELADVAPEDIQQDVEVVRDVSAKQADRSGQSISDPVGAMSGLLVDALMNSGSFRRVDTYTQEQCE